MSADITWFPEKRLKTYVQNLSDKVTRFVEDTNNLIQKKKEIDAKISELKTVKIKQDTIKQILLLIQG